MQQKHDTIQCAKGNLRRPVMPTRRDLLASACLTMGTFWLTGCGGGGGSSSKPGIPATIPDVSTLDNVPHQTKGLVVPPAGFSGSFTTLRIAAQNASVVAADGSFTYDNIGSRPNLIVLKDGADKPVLIGYSDPASGKPAEVSVKTTAAALTFFSIDAYLLPNSDQSAVIGFLISHPAIADLAATLATRIAANRTAIGDHDGAILMAVNQARDAVSKDSRAANLFRRPMLTTSNSSRAAHTKSKVSRGISTRSTTRETGPAVQMLVNPSGGPFSGLIVQQTDDLEGLQITNTFRRPVAYFIQQTGYRKRDANGSLGKDIPITPKQIVNGDFLSSTHRIPGLIGGTADVLNKEGSYQPINSEPPVPLPLSPEGADETIYGVTVVGGGIDSAGMPKAGREPYHTVSLQMRDLSFVLDLLLPALAATMDFQYFPSDHLTQLELEKWEFVAHVCTELPEVGDDIAHHEFKKAFNGVFDALLSNNTQARQVLLNAISAALIADVAANNSNAAFSAFLKTAGALDKLNFWVWLIDKAFAAGDFLAVVHDLNASNWFEEWEVRVQSTKIKIDPVQADITASDTAPFKAVLLGDAAGKSLIYHWSTSGKTGNLSDAVGHRGSDFESSQGVVTFKPNGTAFGSDTISLEVFEKVGMERVSWGSASARISVRELAPAIVPNKVSLLKDESYTFTAKLDPKLNDGGVITYSWFSTSNFGKVTSSGYKAEVASNQGTYKATSSAEGDDIISVEVFSTKNYIKRSLGIATATVKVELKKTIVFGSYQTIAGGMDDVGNTLITATVLVPKVEGAKTYSIHCYDFFDYAYYGREANFGPFTDAVPGALQNGSFLFGISGTHSRPADVADSLAYYDSRFKGMTVEVTVSY